jgi:hypothetical protein
MSQSDYLENAILNAVYNGVPFVSPDAIYVALLLSDPGDDDTGTEVAGAGYARQLVTFTMAASGQIINVTEPAWTAAGANYGTITHTAFYDSLSGGLLLDHGELESPRVINDTQTINFVPGQLVLGRT